MMNDEVRQKMIVLQNCLGHATELTKQQMVFDEELRKADDETILDLVKMKAVKLQQWVFFTAGLKEDIVQPLKEEVVQAVEDD